MKPSSGNRLNLQEANSGELSGVVMICIRVDSFFTDDADGVGAVV